MYIFIVAEQFQCNIWGYYRPGTEDAAYAEKAVEDMKFALVVAGEDGFKELALFRYRSHACLAMLSLQNMGYQAITIRSHIPYETMGELVMSLKPQQGIYDIGDGMCYLLAICAEGQIAAAIAEMLQSYNGRCHIVHPLQEYWDLAGFYIGKLGNEPITDRRGLKDSNLLLIQEADSFIRNYQHEEASLEEMLTDYESMAENKRYKHLLLLKLFSVLIARRLYEAQYKVERKYHNTQEAQPEIQEYYVVTKGWKPGIYTDGADAKAARHGYPASRMQVCYSRFVAEKWLLAYGPAMTEGTCYYAVKANYSVDVVVGCPEENTILASSEKLPEVMQWLREYWQQRNEFLTQNIKRKAIANNFTLSPWMIMLLKMLLQNAAVRKQSVFGDIWQEMAWGIRDMEQEGKLVAAFRYRSHGEMLCKLLKLDGRQMKVSRPEPEELAAKTCLSLGIYDVDDAMHYLLGVCGGMEMGQAIAGHLTYMNHHDHALELVEDRAVQDLAFMENISYGFFMRYSPEGAHATVYEAIWDYIAGCMAEGCQDVLSMVERLYDSMVRPDDYVLESTAYDRITFEKCFFLCWGRYLYQQEYDPKRIFPEKKQTKGKKKRVSVWMAVVQGKKTGVFSQAEGEKLVSGYPHAQSMTFYSKWAAEKWLELQEKYQEEEILKARVEAETPAEVLGKSLEDEAKDAVTLEAATDLAGKEDELLAENEGPLPEMPIDIPRNLIEETVNEDEGEGQEGGTALQEKIGATKKAVAQEKPVKKKVSLIRGIQFDKHIFRNTSREYQDRFRKTIAHKLQKLEHIIRGNVGRAGNDFKLVAVGKGHRRRVYKHRVGSQRLSMVLKDGVITLLRLSSHDRQMVDIRNIRGGNIGYIYYDMWDFLRQVEGWQKEEENLGAYLSTPQHYVYDTAQQDIIQAGDSFVNMSIVGNAGAGKSVVGLKWIEDTLASGQGNCLYLTMSENLVYTLGYEFRKSLEESQSHSRADIITTFDFIRSSFKACYPQIPERCLLNAAQSLEVFREFWQQQVDWKWFWNTRDERLEGQTEETTLLAVWREIHGILKGAVQDFVPGQPYMRAGILPEAEYKNRLRQEKKNIGRNVLWVNTLYKVCNMYQKYLRRQGLYDDNDMAAMLLAKGARYGQQYEAVFLDECQDLTQMELLSIFALLEGTPHKRMASDRCQMVQPTYFSEGWMRTTVNEYDRAMGRKMEEAGQRPYYLHYNYRSTRSIIDFQNFIVDYFYTGDIMTLKLSEMQEIQAPPLAVAGMRPIWICPGEENQRLLIENLWQKVDAASLQVILPFGNSGDRERFQSVADKPIMDIIECKGMEYPNVLMFNVLSEVQFDTALAWKYFYVGATRSNSCLLIYERDAVPGTEIYRFLQDGADLGLVDKCESLLADTSYMDSSWLGYAYQCITENMDDSRLETAENALNFGQYELALDIFRRESQDSNMINYCQGKVHEKHKAYHEALQSYGLLEANWFSQGRTRKNSAEDMLKKPDLSGREFLGAFILSQSGEENLLLRSREAWQYKYGDMKGFYEAFYEALSDYGFAADAFGRWTEKMLAINASLEKRCQLTAQGSLTDVVAKGWNVAAEDEIEREDEADGI